jgi:hypothetical protein
MTLQLLHSELLIYEENFIFFFISVLHNDCDFNTVDDYLGTEGTGMGGG